MAAKLRAKGRKLIAARSIKAPAFNIMDYKLSMVQALNYYTLEVENKDKRKFAYEYWRKQGKDVAKLNSLGDAWFSTIGAVAHMAMNGIGLDEHDLIRLDNAYFQLLQMGKKTEPSMDSTPDAKPAVSLTVTVQDRIRDIARGHIGEIENWIDQFIIKGTTESCKDYLTAKQLKPPVIKHIVDALQPRVTELNQYLSGKDDQLNEGYAYLGKRKAKSLMGYISDMITECQTMAQIAKTTRAPRKRKQQPPSKLVAKLKYLKEYAALNLKSVHPEKIIESDQIWLFDTIKRRMIKYEALDGHTLTVKGTTILNWNPEKSGSKIVRKPEVQLKGVADMSKRPMSNLFNEIKGVTGRVTGRTNDDLIILKVF